jgi:hypothetical protein
MVSVRTIELEGRAIYGTTKNVIDALAWASMRRGNNAWKGNNVIDVIRSYLIEHGADGDLYNATRLRYVMRRLDEEGYASLTTHGKRYIKFEWHGDVDLRSDLPDFVTSKTPVFVQADDILIVDDDDSGLPLPQDKPVRYRAEELNTQLDKFFEVKPDVYGNYVDKLIRSLEKMLSD